MKQQYPKNVLQKFSQMAEQTSIVLFGKTQSEDLENETTYIHFESHQILEISSTQKMVILRFG